MSKNLNDRISEFDTDVGAYIKEKFKDMPAESVMEFVAFLGNRVRMLMIDVTVDTRYNCMREFNKARKLYYKDGKLPHLRDIANNPKGIAEEEANDAQDSD